MNCLFVGFLRSEHIVPFLGRDARHDELAHLGGKGGESVLDQLATLPRLHSQGVGFDGHRDLHRVVVTRCGGSAAQREGFVRHVGDSSNFELRLKHKSRKVWICSKCLKTKDLGAVALPRCKSYNALQGLPSSLVCNARAVTLALRILVDMSPDIAIRREKFTGNLHIPASIVVFVSLCDFKAYVVQVIIH